MCPGVGIVSQPFRQDVAGTLQGRGRIRDLPRRVDEGEGHLLGAAVAGEGPRAPRQVNIQLVDLRVTRIAFTPAAYPRSDAATPGSANRRSWKKCEPRDWS